VADRIHDGVTINAVRTIALTPNHSGQVFPGGTVLYTHTITNNGNALEGDGVVSSINLTIGESLSAWSSVIYYDTNNNGAIDSGEPIVTNLSFVSAGAAGLAAGESVHLLVKVSAPPGAPLGAIDTTTVTATTVNGSYITAVPAVVIATESTAVVSGDLQLIKDQALDANLDGTPDTAYSAADLSAGALPGKAIRYRITVTNKGTAPATAVKVFDSTPAFTTYTSTNPAAVTGGSSPSVTTVPANGAAGALQFDVGTLNPGESAVATFGVIINP
jgi:uncharacterized repeat protein (TIGR01451 family)